MNFSKMTRVVIREAMLEAQRRRHAVLTVEHVLYAYTRIMRGRVLLEGCGVSVAMLREQLEGFFRTYMEVVPDESRIDIIQTVALTRVFDRAITSMTAAGRDLIDLGTILVAIMQEEDNHAVYYLRRQGVTTLDVERYVSHGYREDAEEAERAARSRAGRLQGGHGFAHAHAGCLQLRLGGVRHPRGRAFAFVCGKQRRKLRVFLFVLWFHIRPLGPSFNILTAVASVLSTVLQHLPHFLFRTADLFLYIRLRLADLFGDLAHGHI